MSAVNTQTHPLFTAEIIKYLHLKGIYTIFQFVEQDTEVLCAVTKLPFKSICLLKKHIINKNGATVRNGLEYYNNILQKTAIILTNFPELDLLLKGGFYTGNIYEICSINGKHSFNFVYQFLAKFIAKHLGKQQVMVYDTKYCYNYLLLEHLVQKHSNVELHENIRNVIKENVLVANSTDVYKLIKSLYDLKELITSKKIKVRLVVIDSLPPLLYETATTEKANMLMTCLINIIHLIMVEFHVCFVVINILSSKSENAVESKNVAGGKYWQTAANIRLEILENENGNGAEIMILKSNQDVTGKKCKIDY